MFISEIIDSSKFQTQNTLFEDEHSLPLNEKVIPIINYSGYKESLNITTSEVTKNLDDILGDYVLPNCKFNGILEPSKTVSNLSTISNSTLTDNILRQSINTPLRNSSSTSAPKSAYKSSYFDLNSVTSNSTSNSKDMDDVFADILSEQGYKFSKKTAETTRSINELYQKEIMTQMDPQQEKLLEWSKGKDNNIRGLLCTLHKVLWNDVKWQKCEMSQIVNPADVKKNYRKACLAVHPDKHNGTEHEHIAKLIFMELNQAWSNFENDSKANV